MTELWAQGGKSEEGGEDCQGGRKDRREGGRGMGTEGAWGEDGWAWRKMMERDKI